jgi:hypothetical protein
MTDSFTEQADQVLLEISSRHCGRDGVGELEKRFYWLCIFLLFFSIIHFFVVLGIEPRPCAC